MIAKRDLQRSAPFVHPKRGEPLRSGLRRGAFTSSKRDIPARLRRRPNDFLAAPPASPTAPQAPLAQRLTPLRAPSRFEPLKSADESYSESERRIEGSGAASAGTLARRRASNATTPFVKVS